MALTEEQIQYNKEAFINLLRSTNRPGVEQLIDWLSNRSDFFSAPAAITNHGAYKGGLCEHSLHVYTALADAIQAQKNNTKEGIVLTSYPNETLIIVALLHDLCKVNIYGTEIRNTKNEKGEWYSYFQYKIQETLPLGHGEKSVIMAQNYIRLTMTECIAIRWHMGASDPSVFLSPYTKGAYNEAVSHCPLVLFLQHADAVAAFLMQSASDPKIDNKIG